MKTWSSLVAALEATLEIDPDSDDAWSTTMRDAVLLMGELRCYTEIDFAFVDTVLMPINTKPNTREILVPPTMLLVRYLNYAGGPDGFTTLKMRDISYLEEYVGAGLSGPPRYGAVLNVDLAKGTTIVLAPTPDTVYAINGHAIIRPDPISQSNPQTYLSATYPNLLFAACMTIATGYQKNFGQQSDDPKMAQSWEQQYQIAKAAVVIEENRKQSVTYGAEATSSPNAPTP